MQQCPACKCTSFSVEYRFEDDDCALVCDECGYSEGARLDEVFDHYMRSTWGLAVWWLDYFRRVCERAVTPEVKAAVLAEMPSYPWDPDSEDSYDEDEFLEELATFTLAD